MLSAEQDNRAVSECEVKVTLNATETGEPIRKHFRRFFTEPAEKPRSTSEGRLRRDPAGRNKPRDEQGAPLPDARSDQVRDAPQ